MDILRGDMSMMLTHVHIIFRLIIFIQGKYSTKLFYQLPCNKKDTLHINNNNKNEKKTKYNYLIINNANFQVAFE